MYFSDVKHLSMFGTTVSLLSSLRGLKDAAKTWVMDGKRSDPVALVTTTGQ